MGKREALTSCCPTKQWFLRGELPAQAVVAFFKSEAQNQNSQLMAATEAIVRQSQNFTQSA
jgi:hypothetical protein